ncbi:hypothetical protein DNAM5_120 [Haloarcula californiae tailed virus 1]|uniref:Uncharacterized protein n=1 Tax=Haloarcula californiae tailed virus 1 TaxID=1273746 RepID=R4T884_9CAUD|nr:hypothetical protein M202_gp099 [Haloarcula californiae tailed virus 1]AGM11979.1 hypothetical protein DNAM5_120 [Haloarcula californiae tailed virus 1]
MNAQQLLDEWEEGETTGVRPARVKQIRDDLREVTGLHVPRRTHEIESWLETMKSQVTRKLREAAEAMEESDDGDGEDEDAE